MTVRSKLLLGYGAVLSLVIVAVIAMIGLDRLRVAQEQKVAEQQRLADASRVLGRSLRDEIVGVLGLALFPELQDALVAYLTEAGDTFTATADSMSASDLSPTARELLIEIDANHREFAAVQDRVITLLRLDEEEEALETLLTDTAPVFSQMLAQVDAFRELKVAAVVELRQRLDADVRRTSLLMAAVAVAVLAAGLLIAIRLADAITLQLREGVAQLAGSAAQILATTAQVAASAAQNASAVSQTTATVEEVKQTSEVASQKARQVSDRAQVMAEVAQDGRDAADETILDMQRIQAQMEAVAARIVQLSEQNHSIGEIIATVNDLAEQSNLLAVNAAIEASRAGEHGKGFSVVAQEVRSLAVQSKQATAQVRGILAEIQKATSATVRATEEASGVVQAGADRTSAARDAIAALADSVIEASQAATHIAVSNKQQMVGMDQVAQAMDEIKRGSAQNVAGTRQAEAAARALQELGHTLNRLIAVDERPTRRKAQPNDGAVRN